jgi:hypothetical protein
VRSATKALVDVPWHNARSGRINWKKNSNCVFFAAIPQMRPATTHSAVRRPVLMVYAMMRSNVESVLYFL